MASGLKGCPLEPGTYSSSPFAPTFRFTIGNGWRNHQHTTNGGEIRRDPDSGLAWARDLTGHSAPAIGKSAEALFAFLRSQPHVTASEPVPVVIGGVTGRSIDLTVGKGGQVLVISGPETHPTGWYFEAGYKVRMMALEVGGTLVLFMADASPVKSFDAQMAIVQPVLDTITWD
ncbi:MAG: hypothetical protein ABI553_02835 [Chloroflexota bacterium]